MLHSPPLITWATVGECNIRYPYETHLKLKSREISLAVNLFLSCQIILKFCTEHGNDTAVLCAKFQNDLTINMVVMEEWALMRLTWVLHRLPLRARYAIFLVSSDTDFCFTSHCYTVIVTRYLGIILYVRTSNERRCYIVTSSLIGSVHTQNDPWVPTSQLTHWGRDKIDAISQTTYSNAFSWMKMNEFRLGFHWSLFLRFESTISHHWFR